MSNILVVGGAGYIGSHTCKALASAGHTPIVFDNMSTGHTKAVRWGPLLIGDVADPRALANAFSEFRPTAVIHFAAFAYVGESISDPGKYYRNNVAGTLALLDAMQAAQVGNLVFSSTCATYGVPESVPIAENAPQNPINPYGWSKRMVEQILADYARAYGLSYVALRYFNAAGADPAGELGEWHDPETHLIPRALMAAAGRIPALEIYGSDYPTPDGTCIRDYVHVSDLATAHVQALAFLLHNPGAHQFNLGAGIGVSVREILIEIERSTGARVPSITRPRRPGDPAVLIANPEAARKQLGFAAQHSEISSIIRTAWPFFA